MSPKPHNADSNDRLVFQTSEPSTPAQGWLLVLSILLLVILVAVAPSPRTHWTLAHALLFGVLAMLLLIVIVLLIALISNQASRAIVLHVRSRRWESTQMRWFRWIEREGDFRELRLYVATMEMPRFGRRGSMYHIRRCCVQLSGPFDDTFIISWNNHYNDAQAEAESFAASTGIRLLS